MEKHQRKYGREWRGGRMIKKNVHGCSRSHMVVVFGLWQRADILVYLTDWHCWSPKRKPLWFINLYSIPPRAVVRHTRYVPCRISTQLVFTPSMIFKIKFKISDSGSAELHVITLTLTHPLGKTINFVFLRLLLLFYVWRKATIKLTMFDRILKLYLIYFTFLWLTKWVHHLSKRQTCIHMLICIDIMMDQWISRVGE